MTKVITRSPLRTTRATKKQLELPWNWKPRWYQRDAWTALRDGVKNILIIAHRRWGKDDFALHGTACAQHERTGVYWHMLPEQAQARKAIWTAVDAHTGKRRIDMAFPKPIRRATRDQEMAIEFKGGSLWQVQGSDNYDSLVGSGPVGLVFSEWALADPNAYAYLRPIMLENDGATLFISTPRGRNHAYRMYQAHRDDPSWHVELQSALHTKLFTAEQLEAERLEYITTYGPTIGQALFDQEYLCDFEAAIIGSVYGAELRKARIEKRITRVPYDREFPVWTAWDLGRSDNTSIWFIQVVGGEYRFIDFYTNTGEGMDHYVKVLQGEAPCDLLTGRKLDYRYAGHVMPHDAKGKRMEAKKSLDEQATSMGLKNVIVNAQVSTATGIAQGRLIFSRCYFDEEKCGHGLDALAQYRYNWIEKSWNLSTEPVHDWASHPADAFRAWAMGRPHGIERRKAYERPKRRGKARWP